MSHHELTLGVQTDLSIFTDTMVEMTWAQVKEAAERGDIILLPIGIIEAHGPHMDLSPDVYLGYLFCKHLRQILQNKNISALIAPPFYWGISHDVKKYPGTFSVRPETMKALLTDIFISLNSWGFKNVFIVNAHGDPTHIEMIGSSMAEVQHSLGIKIYNLANLDVALENPPIFPPVREGRFEPDYHAGANETAVMAAFYPQKVNTEMAKGLTPQASFDPYAYCGDPASFPLEKTLMEYYRADLATDALKIQAVLENNM